MVRACTAELPGTMAAELAQPLAKLARMLDRQGRPAAPAATASSPAAGSSRARGGGSGAASQAPAMPPLAPLSSADPRPPQPPPADQPCAACGGTASQPLMCYRCRQVRFCKWAQSGEAAGLVRWSRRGCSAAHQPGAALRAPARPALALRLHSPATPRRSRQCQAGRWVEHRESCVPWAADRLTAGGRKAAAAGWVSGSGCVLVRGALPDSWTPERFISS